MRRPLSALLLSTVVVGGLAACEPPPPGADIQVSSPDDRLRLSTRLVFSTVDERLTPAKAFTVRNAGDEPLEVSNVAIGGASAASFRLVAGPTSFSIPAGGSREVGVLFLPPTPGPTSGGQTSSATLTVSSNDADTPQRALTLKGLNAAFYEAGGEPKLAQITQAIGYGTSVPNSTVRPRKPVFDEVITPYFRRADSNAPAELIPLARYATRTQGATGAAGWNQQRSTSRTTLYNFAGCGTCDPTSPNESGGENQKLFPNPSGPTTFSPPGVFGLFADNARHFSDDGLNAFTDGTGTRVVTQTHNLRIFPAENADGSAIPNTFIVASDLGVDPLDSQKNYDYQDYVFLLTNAVPELNAAPAPNNPAVVNDFSAARPFTLADRDGEGTGFASTQGGYNAANLDLVPAFGGELNVTSTDGTNSGGNTSQQNAVQLAYEGTRGGGTAGTFEVTTRAVGPFVNFNGPFQHQAVFTGPDRDNFLKIEIEYRDGAPRIVVFGEQTGQPIYFVQDIAVPVTANTVDLTLTGNMDARTFQPSYSINGGARVNVGAPYAVFDSLRWFSRQSQGGVLASDQGTAGSFTARYDLFAVSL